MSELPVNFGILGDGKQADETQSYGIGRIVLFRAVDQAYINTEASIDITNPNETQRTTPVVAAVGAPGIRREMIQKWPGKEYLNIISPNAIVDPSVKLEGGCIVAPGAILTTNIKIGEHSIINVGATISHNCKIGEFVTISPGVNIAGDSVIGNGVFVGIGAVISNNVKIAHGVVIGAGAVVIDDIETENSIYAGNPARKIGQNEGWLREI